MGILLSGGDGRFISSDDKDDELVSESSYSVWGDGGVKWSKCSDVMLEWVS